jgi:hypothetical protein
MIVTTVQRVLRSETAGLVAVTLVLQTTGDLDLSLTTRVVPPILAWQR